MKRLLLIGVICLPLAMLEACSSPDPDVTVFVAASAADAFEQVGDQFEAETGATVLVNAAGSSVLSQQIAAGADADLFLSANVDWVAFLEARNFVGERIDLFENRLVLVVPSGLDTNISEPGDLLRETIGRVAVADTDSVPAGMYAKQALSNLGLWPDVEEKLLPGVDVRQALVYVERGEADAGIVYATDAALSDNVRVVYTFESDATESIVYPLVMLGSEEPNPDAVAFFDYLGSADARACFVEHGFVWVNE